jgi:periplasmic divalent cation tolerance protein
VTALVCFCACPDPETAQRIANALVEERLAGCVNVLPGVRSVYRWQGAIERADEVLLLIKTARERLAPLTARVASLHPYELPELVAVEVAGGSAAYLDWVAACSLGACSTEDPAPIGD